MKTIGMIGGISWASTLEYYRILNELTAKRVGQAHSAKLLLASLDIGEIYALMAKNDEEQIYQILLGTAKNLKAGGAEMLILCANGVHRFYDRLIAEQSLPMVNIAEATAKAIQARGLKQIGLLGVRKTMEGSFYPERLRKYGIEPVIPAPLDRDYIDESIEKELVRNVFTQTTKAKYLEVIDRLAQTGAEGVILGCTEIPLLIQQADTSVPVFATTDIHCQATIEAAIQ